ncbi:HD family phosphohydrolase [Thermodesulforhabdus norvegica]|uniref:HDIG domain-containing protein n=1 Tax=Thermodesulforhabdus norvegica TaxID=39841 RepID=A0A1I4QPF2_9BACT|nr:HDIG domain-containing metalloprotein [Thermodesulforhabdus norvegica]SFM41563.1 HDIG domain-containing protein [Thermodesulforhabdus norvegica]
MKEKENLSAKKIKKGKVFSERLGSNEGIVVFIGLCTVTFLSLLFVTGAFRGNQESWLRGLAIFLGFLILTGATLSVPYQIGAKHLFRKKLQKKDAVFLSSALCIEVGAIYCINWFQIHLADVPSMIVSSDELGLLTLLFPSVALPMIVVTFFNVSVAWVFSFVSSIFMSFIIGRNVEVLVYYTLGALFAVHLLYPYHDRIKPIRVGLWTGVFQGLLVLCVLIVDGSSVASEMALCFLAAVFGGILSGILASGLIPVAEYLFGYTTDTRLMELATLDHPLLQELLVHAPGTYQHSIIVGNMVEVAARSIGANALLAKVAAYFHDVGKIKKPLYFIENQFGCENRHDKLAPSMSSLILMSHVKDGVELARKYKLGKEIIEIIAQHHGTSLISYFYQKAVEAREKAQEQKKGTELPPVKEEDFRYPGPKPQTKEAGLVMLADMAEAACRSLPNPTPARVKGMVNKIINQAFVDGQLDECELTLRDLHQIAKHFHQILSTIHHRRIEYPAQEPSTRARETGNGRDSNQQQPAPSDRPEVPASAGGVDLKRLGLS